MAAAAQPAPPSHERGDQQIIEQARNGDRNAFRSLMYRHMRQAYALAYRFVNDHDAAEDVTQEAFVKAYHALPAFRGDSEFGTWLHRIVVNAALTRKRLDASRQQRQVPLEEARQQAHESDHQLDIMRQEHKAHIERALHELPTLQRAVVILRHINGLSTKQVSEILQCSEGTVKTHLFRGLRKLRDKLSYLEEEMA